MPIRSPVVGAGTGDEMARMRGALSSEATVPAAIAFLSGGYDKDKTARYTDLHREVLL